MWAETSSPTQRSWQPRVVGRVGDLSNAHTPALSYVARENCLGVSRFVQTYLDGDPGAWVSCNIATCVDVSVFVFISKILSDDKYSITSTDVLSSRYLE